MNKAYKDYNLSIITVNKNNYTGLINTLNSLYNSLNYHKIEHIVIDGNSSDLGNSFIDLSKKYSFKFISENDYGVYNAMNKGIHFSSNEYLLFLNSGDSLFTSTSISNLVDYFYDYDLIYGNILDCGHSIPKVVAYPEKLSFEYMLCGGLPHQATAIRKRLFDSIGIYSEQYKIISDWVFFMEALFIHNVSYKHIPKVISDFEGGGLSSNSKNAPLIVFEQCDYISRRFPKSLSYYYSNSPYVKKYLRQKSRILRWFFKFMLVKFNKVF